MHYGKVNQKNDYMLNDNLSSSVLSIKDLGITFQYNLTFDEHISKITSTTNSKVVIIRNTSYH